jgi:hypothetical protein
MKRALLALALLAIGCSGKPQGDGASTCSPFGGAGCFYPPTAVATRTQCDDVTEYCDTTGASAPNLACLPNGAPAAGATPARVALTGFVHAFSNGPDTKGLKVQVFEASALDSGTDPRTVTPLGSATITMLDPATQRACDLDPAKGCSIPLAGGCALPTCNDGGLIDPNDKNSGHRPDDQKYCRDDGAGGECSDRLRWEARYTVANVPTNTPLVLRVSGVDSAATAAWATTVAFNVFLSTEDPACRSLSDTDCLDTSDPAGAKYQLDVNALAQSDYMLLPIVAGLPGGITAGQGAIAGEVHDCDNIRVDNVQVSVTPAADRFTYFNGNPVKTVPDPKRAALGTDRLGLFAALNEAPGAVTLTSAGAIASDPTALTTFGDVKAFVYPDTVTIVNVNGGKGKTR